MRISDWSSDVCSSDLDGLERSSSLQAPDHGRSLHLIQPVTEKKVHYRACNERGDAHYQRQAEAVPHHQAVSRGLIAQHRVRSEEHTSELQSLMRISYAVFCLKKKNKPRVTYST